MKKDIKVIASEKLEELNTKDKFTPKYYPKEHLQVDEVVIYNSGGRNQFKKTYWKQQRSYQLQNISS